MGTSYLHSSARTHLINGVHLPSCDAGRRRSSPASAAITISIAEGREASAACVRPLLLAAGGSSSAASARAAAGGEEGALVGYGGPVVTEAERAASAAVSRRVGDAVGLLERGRELQARGEFPEALASFTRVVRECARVGRALVLYEIGDRDESIAEMGGTSPSRSRGTQRSMRRWRRRCTRTSTRRYWRRTSSPLRRCWTRTRRTSPASGTPSTGRPNSSHRSTTTLVGRHSWSLN
ncbi:uncharacterized protein LOC133904484 [Phragmites australis]|uniref:uncharacterized protein LOC133904484 n=1 Tax=Phragmites australis TaxID=29695 RepID=UPI002D788189|nr:uncharacterized protein LOC133904484 [Phragmites australis]